MAVTLPFLLLLLDYWPLGRQRHKAAIGDRASPCAIHDRAFLCAIGDRALPDAIGDPRLALAIDDRGFVAAFRRDDGAIDDRGFVEANPGKLPRWRLPACSAC